MLLVVVLRCCEGAGIRGGPFRVVRREGLRIVVVWRRATFPHPVGWSIIAVPGLSFQVRNGAGRFPWAMAATSLSVMRPHRVVGGVCGCRGTGWWTPRVIACESAVPCVVKDRRLQGECVMRVFAVAC